MGNGGSKQIHLTVTPTALPNGNEVNVTIVGGGGGSTNNICLDLNQAYDITFQLVPAFGVNNWNAGTPFGNEPGGACPGTAQGPSAPFSLKPSPNPNSITIHMDSQTSSSTINYRLNYNDDYTTDPIIIVGLV